MKEGSRKDIPLIVYTNKQGHSRFVREAFAVAERPEVWICSFTDPPLSREPWTIWQHSHIGRLPGVKGAVDLNTFNGDSLQWLDFYFHPPPLGED